MKVRVLRDSKIAGVEFEVMNNHKVVGVITWDYDFFWAKVEEKEVEYLGEKVKTLAEFKKDIRRWDDMPKKEYPYYINSGKINTIKNTIQWSWDKQLISEKQKKSLENWADGLESKYLY